MPKTNNLSDYWQCSFAEKGNQCRTGWVIRSVSLFLLEVWCRLQLTQMEELHLYSIWKVYSEILVPKGLWHCCLGMSGDSQEPSWVASPVMPFLKNVIVQPLPSPLATVVFLSHFGWIHFFRWLLLFVSFFPNPSLKPPLLNFKHLFLPLIFFRSTLKDKLL